MVAMAILPAAHQAPSNRQLRPSADVGGITASNKIYDGNTNATLNTSAAALSGAVAGDDVSLNSAGVAGNFNDKNIGTTKPVAVTGLALVALPQETIL